MGAKGNLIPRYLPDLHGPMTTELAKILWKYSPETGEFRWLVCPHFSVNAGDVAGTINGHGYRMLCFKGKKYKASRIAWLMMKGAFPTSEIDHEDLCRSNDRWSNLREATSGQNKCNHGPRKDNALGIKGVVKTPHGFVAYICFKGKRKNLGSFRSAQAAQAAYASAVKEWHGEFGRVA